MQDIPPTKNTPTSSTKNQYHTPRINNFGRVRQLTTGGFSGNSENGMAWQTMKSMP